MRRIVITGVGAVSALGSSAKRFWDGLAAGEAPFQKITRFDTAPAGTIYAAEARDFESPIPIKPKQPWTANRGIQFAIAAAQEALLNAGLQTDPANLSDIGVVFGSTQSCLDMTIKLDLDAALRGPRTVDPLLFPDANPCAPSCRVSLQCGLNAFNTILSNGPTAGLDAIAYAAGAIRSGMAPLVIAGGIEELTRMTFLFHQSLERLASGAAACKPFAGRGVVLGEGCAVLVLEDAVHARMRGATILAEIGGYGTCFWPEGRHHENSIQAPEYAMRNAMNEAGLEPDEIDAVFASANGDPSGDDLEARALKNVVPGATVSAVKAALGETHSAGGALQTAACVLAMREGRIPFAGSANLGTVGCGMINNFSTSASTHSYSSLILKAALPLN